MNIKIKFFALIICALIVCMSFVACNKTENNVGEDGVASDAVAQTQPQNEETEINYENTNVDNYVKNVQYKELDVSFDSNKVTKEDAVWDAIYSTAIIEDYPDDKVNYYFNQMKDAYMHCAHGNEADYLLLLKARGTSEADMLEKSRQMVKEDLVYRYIVKHEQITVTDEEKASLFNKYVQKYSAELNKSPDYVEKHMAEYIYESMLYDKTTEYLFSVNTFVTNQ